MTVCFGCLALAAIGFIYWSDPETKGLGVEEVVQVFGRQRGTASSAAAIQHEA